MEDYLHRSGLICINDGKPTRRQSDSVIDLFIVSPRVVPEVAICETMSHEVIRSDHIGVLLQVYEEYRYTNAILEKFIIGKAKYNIWSECTEKRFKVWNESDFKYNSVDEMADSFMEVYTECMIEAVPKKEIRIRNRRKKPPWWNDKVTEAKNELNKAKKSFRRRSTIENFEVLKITEDAFDKAAEEAKVAWTQVLCGKISFASSGKEMWESLNKLTTYQEYNSGGVLPLKDEDGKAVFDREEKCALLEKVFFAGKHLEDCKFDEQFKRFVEKSVLVNDDDSSEKSREELNNCNEFLNYEISIGEVEAALQLLKTNKSPGPDEVFTELLKNAGEEFKMAICKLFQRSWNEAVVPSKWKVAEVKFLRKNGKNSYHDPGSYRPISLTSYLCKSMERIVTHRLYGFAEHFNLIDKEQEGFRRFRGTVDALLRLTQDIVDGFNKKESTAALFIDIEKAYDSVWHEGLLFKLKELGIRGRVWEWIKNFLKDRKAVINMAGKRAQEFCIKIGLPQGSVLSPLLFLLFIVDCFKNVSGKKVKFADDGTIWKSGEDWRYLLDELKEDFKRHVCEYAGRWRLKISIMKTEFCVFSLDNHILEEASKYNFTIDDKIIKHNPTPTLDEKLKFELHTEKVEQKALKTVALLRKVKETEAINTKCMLQLYKALVTPQ